MPNSAVDLETNDIHVQATHRLTEALLASEKRMRRRIELLTEVVFETCADGTITFLNRAWTKTLGYAVEESLGKQLSGFVAESDWGDVRTLTEVRMRHRDGGLVWMEVSAVALEEGGVVGTLRDMTQQRAAQAELAMLSLVASYTESLVVIADGWGRTEWVNASFTRKTGYALAEVVGRKPGRLLQGPETDPVTVRMLQERLRMGQPAQCEILNYTKAGEKYWTSIHISPIRNAAGVVERFVAIQTDITALRAAQQAAEQASEAKTQFLATISHEMRTPLNVILGTTELALESAREPGVVQALGRVNENAETLMGLISDLLDVSKIEAGQFEWERVAFPLRARLRQAVAPAAERAIRKGVAFSVSIDEGLPETVLGDATRLRQIVANLAENAVKFTDCGYVSVEALGAGTGLELRVSDSGAGVPEAVLPFLFDRFFQGDSSTTRRKGGAGLGLSIVKSLVNAMGGSVSVRNVPGAGAEFRVWVPIEAVAVVAEAPLPVAAPVAVGDILVAEDNDDNFAIVERHLTNQGYRLERAVNGLAAVSAAARKQFDLILMDVEMPEMDGLEATRLIRAGGSAVPIVALTAHAVMGYRERCLAVGCTGYLAKPVRKRELLEGVAAALLRA